MNTARTAPNRLRDLCSDGYISAVERLTRLGITVTAADLPPGQTAYYDAAAATLRISTRIDIAEAVAVAADMWLSVVTGAPSRGVEHDPPLLTLVR